MNRAFDELWAALPSINCKGLCHTTCGVIDLTVAEQARIRDRHGIEIPHVPGNESLSARPFTDCPALTVMKTCAVYADRPTVCRVWGVSEDLRCIYGCSLDDPSTELTSVDAAALLCDAVVIGGPSPLQRAQLARIGRVNNPPTGDEMRAAAAANPGQLGAYRERLAQGMSGDDRRRADRKDT